MTDNRQETLRAQLAELNQRSHWYSAQLWQLPFAYLGITGVALASLDSAIPRKYAITCFAAGVLGLLVLIHMFAVRRLEKRAIAKLSDVEKELGLAPAEDSVVDVYPMIIATFLGMAFYFALGVHFFRQP
jgi:hypothetical protein